MFSSRSSFVLHIAIATVLWTVLWWYVVHRSFPPHWREIEIVNETNQDVSSFYVCLTYPDASWRILDDDAKRNPFFDIPAQSKQTTGMLCYSGSDTWHWNYLLLLLNHSPQGSGLDDMLGHSRPPLPPLRILGYKYLSIGIYGRRGSEICLQDTDIEM